VILLDAYGLLALLLDEPAADDVEAPLRGRSAAAIPSVNLFEVVDYLVGARAGPRRKSRAS